MVWPISLDGNRLTCAGVVSNGIGLRRTLPLKRCGHLLLLSMATSAVIGCKMPWGGTPGGGPPSFDRLMELEGGASNMTPASIHPQVHSRRPGPGQAALQGQAVSAEKVIADDRGKAATIHDEISNPHGDGSSELAERRPKNRRLSDLDTEADESEGDSELSPEHRRLLANTQQALRQSATRHLSDTDSEQAMMEGQISQRSISSRQDSQRRETPRQDTSRQDTQRNQLADASPSKAQSEVVPASFDSSKSHRDVGEQDFPEQHQQSVGNSSLTWQRHLQMAMKQLQQQTEDGSESAQSKSRQVMVSRLLALALNDREAMLEPIDGLPADEQDYFSYQLSALFDALDPDAHPSASRKWSLVMLNQRKATGHLASLSNLEISNLAFCTEVIDFGVVTQFADNKFTQDQEVLLYLELDNFVSEKAKDGKGFETQLQGSYEIIDAGGRRVADQQLPADSHVCKNVRRDYFIAYRVYMPAKIEAGKYTLKLTIEDIKGRKFGHAQIPFQIQ